MIDSKSISNTPFKDANRLISSRQCTPPLLPRKKRQTTKRHKMVDKTLHIKIKSEQQQYD